MAGDSPEEIARNIMKAFDGAEVKLIEAIEATAEQIAKDAKSNHFARRIGTNPVKYEQSMGGENRAKNPDGTPRYGDITGMLSLSIKPEPVRIKRGKIVGRVTAGSSLNYAQFVEFGTRKSKPHPYMEPAALSGAAWVKKTKIFSRAFEAGLKKGEAT